MIDEIPTGFALFEGSVGRDTATIGGYPREHGTLWMILDGEIWRSDWLGLRRMRGGVRAEQWSRK